LATQKQIEANRRNAKLSTGPKTAKGKARVSKNAIRHGVWSINPVVNGLEAPRTWEAFESGIRDSLAPVGMLEEALAERVAFCLWRLRRTAAYETGATREAVEEEKKKVHAVPFDDGTEQVDADQQSTCPLETLLGDREEELESHRDYVKGNRSVCRLLEELDHLPSETPVAAEDGAWSYFLLFNGVYHCLPDDSEQKFDFYDPGFLAGLGVPSEYQSKDQLRDWPGWTVGFIRQAIAGMAKVFGVSPTDALANAIETNRDDIQLIATLETTVKDLRWQVKESMVRIMLKGILPDDCTLAKISRYEAHLSQQMFRTLHELQLTEMARKKKEGPRQVVGEWQEAPKDGRFFLSGPTAIG
jgi:hypothetical protein